jgi:hypothetical protein
MPGSPNNLHKHVSTSAIHVLDTKAAAHTLVTAEATESASTNLHTHVLLAAAQLQPVEVQHHLTNTQCESCLAH